jgi:hypothetical protein
LGVNDRVLSAKWSGLPETGDTFESGASFIVFYNNSVCERYKSSSKMWLVSTQSTANLYFPEDLRLDGINDASSFLVINSGLDEGTVAVCGESVLSSNTNTTPG